MIFYFLRLIVKDKIAQVSELVSDERALGQDPLSRELIDIYESLGQLFDKKLTQFLKTVFTLYFELSSVELWRVDSQMLLLSTLDL